jgi:dinuclear metal center YbgI/SA1388 family protein
MKTSVLIDFILEMFDQEKLSRASGEYGFFIPVEREVQKIGYATNLTPDVVNFAANNGIDLIITHHDAWDFIYGMKESCTQLMTKYKIAHFFTHLPLDDAEFGTNVSFLKNLNISIVDKTTLENDVFYCGRIGKTDESVELQYFVSKIENLLGEKIKVWQNNNKHIEKVGFVAGAGSSPSIIKEFVDKGCDTYITGEKVLYTIQYCKFSKINLIVGSHTFVELFGVKSLCNLIKDKYEDLEVVQIIEEHIE